MAEAAIEALVAADGISIRQHTALKVAGEALALTAYAGVVRWALMSATTTTERVTLCIQTFPVAAVLSASTALAACVAVIVISQPVHTNAVAAVPLPGSPRWARVTARAAILGTVLQVHAHGAECQTTKSRTIRGAANRRNKVRS